MSHHHRTGSMSDLVMLGCSSSSSSSSRTPSGASSRKSGTITPTGTRPTSASNNLTVLTPEPSLGTMASRPGSGNSSGSGLSSGSTSSRFVAPTQRSSLLASLEPELPSPSSSAYNGARYMQSTVSSRSNSRPSSASSNSSFSSTPSQSTFLTSIPRTPTHQRQQPAAANASAQQRPPSRSTSLPPINATAITVPSTVTTTPQTPSQGPLEAAEDMYEPLEDVGDDEEVLAPFSSSTPRLSSTLQITERTNVYDLDDNEEIEFLGDDIDIEPEELESEYGEDDAASFPEESEEEPINNDFDLAYRDLADGSDDVIIEELTPRRSVFKLPSASTSSDPFTLWEEHARIQEERRQELEKFIIDLQTKEFVSEDGNTNGDPNNNSSTPGTSRNVRTEKLVQFPENYQDLLELMALDRNSISGDYAKTVLLSNDADLDAVIGKGKEIATSSTNNNSIGTTDEDERAKRERGLEIIRLLDLKLAKVTKEAREVALRGKEDTKSQSGRSSTRTNGRKMSTAASDNEVVGASEDEDEEDIGGTEEFGDGQTRLSTTTNMDSSVNDGTFVTGRQRATLAQDGTKKAGRRKKKKTLSVSERYFKKLTPEQEARVNALLEDDTLFGIKDVDGVLKIPIGQGYGPSREDLARLNEINERLQELTLATEWEAKGIDPFVSSSTPIDDYFTWIQKGDSATEADTNGDTHCEVVVTDDGTIRRLRKSAPDYLNQLKEERELRKRTEMIQEALHKLYQERVETASSGRSSTIPSEATTVRLEPHRIQELVRAAKQETEALKLQQQQQIEDSASKPVTPASPM